MYCYSTTEALKLKPPRGVCLSYQSQSASDAFCGKSVSMAAAQWMTGWRMPSTAVSLMFVKPLYCNLQYLLDPGKGLEGAEVNQLHVHGGSALMEVRAIATLRHLSR